MNNCSAGNVKEEICLEVDLLNRACLDLVGQIEDLKMENDRLKELIKKGKISEPRSEPSTGSS
jgi:hypothetical protein